MFCCWASMKYWGKKAGRVRVSRGNSSVWVNFGMVGKTFEGAKAITGIDDC